MDENGIELRRDIAMACRARLIQARDELTKTRDSLRAKEADLVVLERTAQREASRLALLEAGRGELLTQEGAVKVYEFWLDVPGYSGPIEGAVASLTQYGDIQQVGVVHSRQKSGLGGGIVGGLLLGPVGAAAGVLATRKNQVSTTVREVDTRQLELSVAGPGYAWSCTANVSESTALRTLRDLIIARGSTSEKCSELETKSRSAVASLTSEICTLQHDIAEERMAASACQSACTEALDHYKKARLPVIQELRFSWECTPLALRILLIIIAPGLAVLWVMGLIEALFTGNEQLAFMLAVTGTVHLIFLAGAGLYYLHKTRS